MSIKDLYDEKYKIPDEWINEWMTNEWTNEIFQYASGSHDIQYSGPCDVGPPLHSCLVVLTL
jgi:hypothetical protein